MVRGFPLLDLDGLQASGRMLRKYRRFQLQRHRIQGPNFSPGLHPYRSHGELVTLSDFEGKVVVLAFIYTSCPDVCLIVSSNLQWIKTNLDSAIEEEVVFLSITIDPARDTVDRFSKWTESVGYEWQHLTSSDVDYLVEVWSDWNVVVDNDHINASVPPEGSMNRVAVLNPDGEFCCRHALE